MTEEIQCRICGCRFNPDRTKTCECNCTFGGCHGKNVRCPNCGYDMPRPAKNTTNKTSAIEKLRKSIKKSIITSEKL